MTPPTPPLRILHLEDSGHDAELISHALAEDGVPCRTQRVASRPAFQHALEHGTFDLILADYTMPGFSGMDALCLVRERDPNVPFIFVTGSLGEEKAIETIRLGATDYVLKDRLPRLANAVTRAVREAHERAERRRVQDALERNEAYLRLIIDNTLVLIAVLDGDGVVRFNNPSFERLLGCPPGGLLGTRAWDLVHPDDLPALPGLLAEAVQHPGRAVPTNCRLGRRDGAWRELECVILGLAHLFHTPMVLLSAQDITERRADERRIREQAALLEAANDAIIVRDLEQRIAYWNHGAERLYGWNATEAIGQTATELLHPTHPPESTEALQTVLQKGDWQGELQHTTRQGKPVIVNSHWTLLRDEAGRPKSILAINADLTEKKHIEAQYLRAQRMESIGILAGGIAHDLNNILAPILMAAPMLRSIPPGQTTDSLLQTIETSAQRGADLVRQILAFARGGAGEHTELHLRHLIADLGRMVRGTFPRAIEIHTALPRDLWRITGDATQLYQVLMNLCVNARDAMPDGGCLEIRAANLQIDRPIPTQPEARPGPYVVLTIQDTGAGIPPEILDRIFDPFFTTKEVGKGTGLGLSTVLAIVKNHDGFVAVQSTPGQGSRFDVHLPALAPAKTAHPTGSESTLPRGHGQCLLVIDDEHTVREMTHRVLEFYGYQVLTANNGAEAVTRYQADHARIHLVITDMMMPRMDGAAAIHALRRINPAVKIIATSGLLVPSPETEAALATVNAVLNKPYPSGKLLRTVHELLRTPA
jgi:PAS domain S-box-containing protein